MFTQLSSVRRFLHGQCKQVLYLEKKNHNNKSIKKDMNKKPKEAVRLRM